MGMFTAAASRTVQIAGKPATFIGAVAIIIIWAATGPIFHYSDTWHLVINTGTTIVTFLMVFLLQNAQNRDAAAIQIKLDELILATAKARNRMVSLEDMTEEELATIKQALVDRASSVQP